MTDSEFILTKMTLTIATMTIATTSVARKCCKMLLNHIVYS